MSIAIERLAASVRRDDRLGASMAQAFRDEPNFAFMLPDHSSRERPLQWFFGSFLLRLGIRHGEVYATHDRDGAAVWMHPASRVAFLDAVRAGALALPFHFGLANARRSLAVGEQLDRIRKTAAPEMHWYLAALGVRPAAQGRGIGTALLHPLLARADADGTPCYLETFRERAAVFYRRLGFEVVHTDAALGRGPSFWCMTRRPARIPNG